MISLMYMSMKSKVLNWCMNWTMAGNISTPCTSLKQWSFTEHSMHKFLNAIWNLESEVHIHCFNVLWMTRCLNEFCSCNRPCMQSDLAVCRYLDVIRSMQNILFCSWPGCMLLSWCMQSELCKIFWCMQSEQCKFCMGWIKS